MRLVLATLAATGLAACGGAVDATNPKDSAAGRAITGSADAQHVVAVDSHGNTFTVAPKDGAFELALPTKHPVHLFLETDGLYTAVRFPERLGGPSTGTAIPNGDAPISVGKLATAPDEDASAEENPLDQVDSDEDGDSDLRDDDDDDDGEEDDADEDADGDGENDDDHDLDTDDDGEQDLTDDDDDDDGIHDDEDDDGGDSDDDGVSDENDEDDDNDGEDDGDDEDDDGDGVDDEDDGEEDDEDDGEPGDDTP